MHAAPPTVGDKAADETFSGIIAHTNLPNRLGKSPKLPDRQCVIPIPSPNYPLAMIASFKAITIEVMDPLSLLTIDVVSPDAVVKATVCCSCRA